MELEPDTSNKAAAENGTVLGVDPGVNTLLVASTSTLQTGNEFDHRQGE